MPFYRMVSSSRAQPAAGGMLVQPESSATVCEFDQASQNKPRHAVLSPSLEPKTFEEC